MSDTATPKRRQRLKVWATRPRLSMTNTVLVVVIALMLGWHFFSDPYAHPRLIEPSSRLDHDYTWTTLGTNSGPVARPDRSEPANLLWNDDTAVLVDAGDGTAEQLAKIHVNLDRVGTILISHLHIDHTGGLYALLGMRLQTNVTTPLTIMGPPGTADTVATIQDSLKDLHAFGFDVPGFAKGLVPKVAQPKVVEISDGDTFTLGASDDVEVTAVANSHYQLEPGDEDFEKFQSFAYRFDMPDRSIVFTGDTGPSDRVTDLAKGADLLISEITDLDQVVADLHATGHIPKLADPVLKRRFSREHLTAPHLAEMAQDAGVGAVVVTHNPLTEVTQRRAADVLASGYDGPVAFAEDLQNW